MNKPKDLPTFLKLPEAEQKKILGLAVKEGNEKQRELVSKVEQYPIVIELDGKYYRLKYEDGKIKTEATLEVDKAAKALFDRLSKHLDQLIAEVREEERTKICHWLISGKDVISIEIRGDLAKNISSILADLDRKHKENK